MTQQLDLKHYNAVRQFNEQQGASLRVWFTVHVLRVQTSRNLALHRRPWDVVQHNDYPCRGCRYPLDKHEGGSDVLYSHICQRLLVQL